MKVSVATLREDREMISMYAEASVAEVWIVNAAERCVEIYREPSRGEYTVAERVGLDGTVRCASLPSVMVNVSELFADMPTVEEILNKAH